MREVRGSKMEELFGRELVVINLGLELFAEALASVGVEVLQMDWRPPAGGDERLLGMIERLGR